MVQRIEDKLCPFTSNAVAAMHRSPIAAPGTPAQQVTIRLAVPCCGPECQVFDERIGDCGAKGQWVVLAGLLGAILERLGGKAANAETKPESGPQPAEIPLDSTAGEQ